MTRSKAPRSEAREVRRLRRLLKDLWPILSGCVTVSRRPCGRGRRCKRCRSGERHPAVYFMFRRGREARNVYLPAEVVGEVKRGIRNGRVLQEAMARASVATVEALKEEARAKRTG